jgi:hypothetical protein
MRFIKCMPAWRAVVVGTEEIQMTELQPVEEGTGQSSTYGSGGDSNEEKKLGSYRAALKLTSPWLPIMAVVLTTLTYLLPEELLGRAVVLFGSSINEGVIASFVGLALAFAV